MSFSEPRLYLVSYDIASPKRLVRVHRVVRRYGVAVQYSVFAAQMRQPRTEHLIVELTSEIHRRQDDVRLYPIPSACQTVVLGRGSVGEGVWLAHDAIMRLLASTRKTLLSGGPVQNLGEAEESFFPDADDAGEG